jgi:hypothetical protein
MSGADHQSKENDPQYNELPFSRDDVLRCSNEILYEKISTLAIQLAILGYTDTASNLVGKMNKHNWYHGRDAVIWPLQILWDQVDNWPDGEKDRVRESIHDERKRAAEQKVKNDHGEETGKKVKLEVDESPITDEDIKKEVDGQYHSYAEGWWYPERPRSWAHSDVGVPQNPHGRDVNLSVDELKEKVTELINAFHDSQDPDKDQEIVRDNEPFDPSAALVSALELRIKLREKNRSDGVVPSEHEIMEMIAKSLNYSQIACLIQSRRAWSMLSDGVLLKIDKDKVELFAKQLEEAVTERLEKGKQSFPDLTMKQLVDLIDKNTRTNPASVEYFRECDNEIPSTILHDPASASLIAATEKRLETTLPDDYKEYLSVTNGNDPAFGGIILEAPLWKCEDIRWFQDDEDYFSDLPIDIPADMCSITHQTTNDGLDWPKIGRGIIIGMEDIDSTFLIAPATVNNVKDKVRSLLESEDERVTQQVKDSVKQSVESFAGSMEAFEKLDWCCVTWASGGAASMHGYKSFKAYLWDVTESSGKSDKKDLWNFEYDEFFGDMLKE